MVRFPIAGNQGWRAMSWTEFFTSLGVMAGGWHLTLHQKRASSLLYLLVCTIGCMTTAADRLIESTRELLWERGYVGTSPKAIQQLAGAGQGSMYHHFEGKPDLARAAIERTAAEMT